MSRHRDWSACVCLVGGGQEINSGEDGLFGWGEALRKIKVENQQGWSVFAGPDALNGGPSAGSLTLGDLPSGMAIYIETDLQVRVPQRSYRSPSLSRWVDFVLAGNAKDARVEAEQLHEYPLVITRSLAEAKAWLRESGRGERRYGLVASSGARRLRADGLGITLNALDGNEIAHWYLNSRGDRRSSFASRYQPTSTPAKGLSLTSLVSAGAATFFGKRARNPGSSLVFREPPGNRSANTTVDALQ